MPPEETIVATPVTESVPKNGSQVTPLPLQEEVKPQEVAPAQVEVREPIPSNPQTGRPRPSDFYGFRKENQQLKEQLRAQQAQIDEILKSRPAPAPQGPTVPDYLKPDKFWENTPENLMKLQQEAEQRAYERMKQDFPNLYKEVRQTEQLQGRALEAMELILPKDKGNETLEQRHDKHQDKVNAVFAIMEREGLNYIPDPVQRTKMALRIYDEEMKIQQPQRPVNPNAIDKKLMGGMPSAQPIGGGKKMPTLAEARAELKRLTDMKDANEDLRHQDAFKQQLAEATKQVRTLVLQEQGNINQ